MITTPRLMAMDPSRALNLIRAAAQSHIKRIRHLQGDFCAMHADTLNQAKRIALHASQLRGLLIFRRALHRLGKRSQPAARSPIDDAKVESGERSHTHFFEVNNPHWPDLSSHGTFVEIGWHYGARQVYVEIQLLAADLNRSQWCTTRTFRTVPEAKRFANRMLSAGLNLAEVIATENKRKQRKRAQI